MKTKILILFAILVGTHCNVYLQAQEELPDVLWSNDYSVRIAKFSPDGQSVYFVKNSDLTNLFKADAMTGEISSTYSYQNQRIFDFDISTTSDSIIVFEGLNIVIWSTQTGDTLKIITSIIDSLKTKKPPKTIKYTPDSKKLIVVIGDDPEIVILDIETGMIIKEFHGYNASGLLDVSPDGKFFAFHYWANNWRSYVDLIDLNTYENLGTLETFLDDMYINYLYITDNRTIAAAGRTSKYLYIWDKETQKIIKTPQFDLPEFGYFIKFAITNDSKYIFISNEYEEDYSRNRLFVYDLDKGKIIHEYNYDSRVNLEVSQDGYILSSDAYQLRVLNPTWKRYIGVKEVKEEKIKHTFFNSKLKMFFDEEIFDMPVINIYNILGVAVGAHCNVSLQMNNEIEIDLNYLSSGIYFVQVNVNGKIYILKISNY
ncbi:MAG: T9SS type A sorting domain-containing protein [bacterium]